MGEGVIGPRNNVFPGPAVALDGPVGGSHLFLLSDKMHEILYMLKTTATAPGLLKIILKIAMVTRKAKK